MTMNPLTKAENLNLLVGLEYFTLYAGMLPPRLKSEIPTFGYLVINNHTGVIEAEGSNFANSLVGLYYVEREYIRIVADPAAELKRRQGRIAPTTDFASLFEPDPEDDPTIQ